MNKEIQEYISEVLMNQVHVMIDQKSLNKENLEKLKDIGNTMIPKGMPNNVSIVWEESYFDDKITISFKGKMQEDLVFLTIYIFKATQEVGIQVQNIYRQK